jgi:hypothetical protein
LITPTIFLGVQIMKLLIMMSPPVPCYFVRLTPTYLRQKPILENRQQ